MATETQFKQTDIGQIAVDWEVNTLGDIGKIEMCKRIFSYETNEDGEIPFYKIGTFGKEPDAFISQKLYNKYKHKFSFPKKGAILISASGTIGRTIIYDGKPSYFQDSNIVWIRNDEKLISNKLLYYVLQNVKYESEGSTIQRLYNSIIKSAKFPLPPLPEQEAIAEVLSDTDELIQTLEKKIAKKRLIKQGAMQTLLTPKDDWEVFTFESLCKVFTKQTGFDYSAYIKPQLINNYEIGCIPFIQNKDFYNQYINYDTDYYIPYSVAKKFPNILLNERCLLISISGKVGNVGLFCNSKTAFIGGAVAIGKFKNIKLLDWVMNYILSEKGQYQLLKNVKEGSHKNLILDDIRKLSIPIPKKTHRDYITNLLSDMDNEINALEKKLSKTKELKQGLMQQLLTGKIRLV